MEHKTGSERATNPNRKPIRVLIIDDSAFIRQFLTGILNETGDFQVIAAVSDPLKAIKNTLYMKADVITLDLEMPHMDGLEFLRLLMRTQPKPVVMISSWTRENSEIALKALALGAVDFVTKPTMGLREGMNRLKEEIITKIRAAAAARIPAPALPAQKPAGESPSSSSAQPVADRLEETTDKVIAIGASTGGTVALTEIFKTLNPNVPGLILVQHLPPMFTASFAASLNEAGRIRVKEAKSGDQILPGHALVVPGGKNLLVKRSGAKYFVELTPPIEGSIYNPSINQTFFSVAREAGKNAMGIILTGMGDDGAEGLKALRESEGYTIAQDEKTSVIYGMPQKAWEIGAAVKQVPLEEIADEIHLWAERLKKGE
ncbi:MAG: chemotaxis response regulator protein-glutamate methylesterase [Firmicutes bacterium]|nr:chemotaxis response regulator protein-glutamate methylesterase [Bacillota bacterium]